MDTCCEKLKAAGAYPNNNFPFKQPIEPKALDDAGAVCAAMIKSYCLLV